MCGCVCYESFMAYFYHGWMDGRMDKTVDLKLKGVLFSVVNRSIPVSILLASHWEAPNLLSGGEGNKQSYHFLWWRY